MPLKCLIFDFFGTLAVYEKHVEICDDILIPFVENQICFDKEELIENWKRTFTQMENESKENYKEFSMYDFANRLKISFPNIQLDIFNEVVDLYMKKWVAQVRILNETKGIITKLANKYEMAIISNTHYKSLVGDILNANGLAHYFKIVVLSVEFGYKKPHKKIFERTLELLEKKAEEAIFIGDNWVEDIIGAKEAGISSILIGENGINYKVENRKDVGFIKGLRELEEKVLVCQSSL